MDKKNDFHDDIDAIIISTTWRKEEKKYYEREVIKERTNRR